MYSEMMGLWSEKPLVADPGMLVREKGYGET